jgi:bla regulator protein BlaR1
MCGESLATPGNRKLRPRPAVSRILLTLVAILMHSTLSAQTPPQSSRSPAFDVISIRPSKPGNDGMAVQWGLPNEFRSTDNPLFTDLLLAYFPPPTLMSVASPKRIIGAPPWVLKDNYDFVAKVAPEDVAAWQTQGADKPLLQAMLQTTLKQRCKLVAHRSTTEVPAYSLVLRKPKPALQKTGPDEKPPANAIHLLGDGYLIPYQRGATQNLPFLATSMESLAIFLSNETDRPVIDATGLAGLYDFSLVKLDTDPQHQSDPQPMGPYDLEALGLKLVPAKTTLSTIVIDHIEKPSEN